jgi:3'(2'), 5'-bisphosphate nucleotidase
VRYSLVYFPEDGTDGSWLEVRGDRVVVGPDDHGRTARAVLDALPAAAPSHRHATAPIWVSGFAPEDERKASLVSATGLVGVTGGTVAVSVYPALARGDLGGGLVHTPNVYDFPVFLHVARAFGGDAVWVGNDRPVDFGEIWLDSRAGMLRLPGIVACAVDRAVLPRLVALAQPWSPVRYAD